MNEDIRWKRRFDNFSRAYASLRKAWSFRGSVRFPNWNSRASPGGNSGLVGSRDAVRSAFRNGLIDDVETWMEKVKARNLSSHAYDPKIADTIDLPIFSALEHPGLRKHIERVRQVFYERNSFAPPVERNGLPLGEP